MILGYNPEVIPPVCAIPVRELADDVRQGHVNGQPVPEYWS